MILEVYLSNEKTHEFLISQYQEVVLSIMYVLTCKPISLDENNTDFSKKQETYNSNKTLCIKLLEKVLNSDIIKDEINKIQNISLTFKPEAITEKSCLLEKSLIFFSCTVQIKHYSLDISNSILNVLSSIIHKEIQFIESSKKDNILLEKVGLTMNRLLLETELLKLINLNITSLHLNVLHEERVIVTSNLLKDVNSFFIDILEKSSTPEILMEVVEHLSKNLNLLLNSQPNPHSVIEADEIKIFDINLFETGLLDKTLLAQINVLRKNLNDEALSLEIIKLLLSLTKVRSNICNLLVKSGCVRLVFNVLESAGTVEAALLCLRLIRNIMESSQENLEMTSKQSK